MSSGPNGPRMDGSCLVMPSMSLAIVVAPGVLVLEMEHYGPELARGPRPRDSSASPLRGRGRSRVQPASGPGPGGGSLAGPGVAAAEDGAARAGEEPT